MISTAVRMQISSILRKFKKNWPMIGKNVEYSDKWQCLKQFKISGVSFSSIISRVEVMSDGEF